MSPQRNKEVSVAGESPGKTEQRKSSETAEERDPRLAAFRGPSAAADADTTGGSTGSSPDGGTDSATAVFRVPPPAAADAPGSAPDAPEGTSGDPEAPSAPEGASAARQGAGGAATEAADATGTDAAAPGASVDESGTEAEAEAGADIEAGSGSPAGAGAGANTEAESATGSPAGTAPADTRPHAAVETPDDAPASGVPGSREQAPSAEETPPTPDGRGTDHPTAVLTAPRAGRVDQPTTVLKPLPKATVETKGNGREDGRRPASWAAEPPGTTEAPEAAAERTSTFVPLRSDDVRPAAVVGPTVTPDVTAGPGTPASPGTGLTEAERTRQQPMPPRPPLDLLAELTNTPPPPETPVRTAVRRVKIWTPILLLVLVIFAIAQSVRPLPEPTLTLSAAPTYTFGGGKLDMPWPAEGQGAVEVEGVGALGSYGQEKSAPIASMAKVMTAYVILQGHPLTGEQTGGKITVDKQAGDEAGLEDESRVAIEEGDEYTERQMLEMLMIPSGNNVARLLARWDAGTEKAFVGKMNAAAEDLGMTNSTYTDPSGLKSSTVSTPADQIKLGKAVMENDVFREVVNMPQADIPGVGRIYNNNYILLEDGVNGIKTGSSTPAGGNLLWTADTVVDGKNRRIIGAVMGATLEGTLDAKLERARQNSLKLIKAAQKGVGSATVVRKGQVVGHVDNGFGEQTPVVATEDLKAVGWGGLVVDLKLSDGGKTPAHTAKAGTVVGEVTVGTGAGKVSVPVALRSEMAGASFGDKLIRIT